MVLNRYWDDATAPVNDDDDDDDDDDDGDEDNDDTCSNDSTLRLIHDNGVIDHSILITLP